MPYAGEGKALLLNAGHKSLKTKCLSNFCIFREKYKEGSEPLVLKLGTVSKLGRTQRYHKNERDCQGPKVSRWHPFSQIIIYEGS